MKRLILLRFGFLLSLTLTAGAIPASSQEAQREIVLATVNDDTIAADQLLGELVNIHSGRQETTRSQFDVEKLLNRLVNDRLLIQDARLMGLDQEPELLGEVENYRQACALEQYLADAIPDTFPLTEQAIGEYYSQQFRQVNLFLLRLRDRQQADSAAGMLRPGAHLAEVAAAFPLEIYRFGGGDQGFKTWRELDNTLHQQVQPLDVGQIAGPFEHGHGYSFVELLGEQPADPAQLERQRPRIKYILNEKKKVERRQDLVQSLRGKYAVTIDDSLLQRFLASRDTTSRQAMDQDLVIAEVGGQAVTIKKLKRRLGHGAGKGDLSAMGGRVQDALEGLIEERLFQQEAVARNYEANPQVLEKTRVVEDSLLLYGYLEQVVVPQVEVSPVAIDSFYQIRREDFRRADDVRLSQITVGTPDSAQQIMDRLREGADFGWMVKEYSTDTYAVKGGDRGWFNLSTLAQNMRADLDTARLGQCIGPYPEEEGYIIYRLSDRRRGEIPELGVVKGRVRQQLYQIEFGRVLDEILAKLKESAVIMINHEALNNLIIGGIRE